jgi:hypothetical protein
MTTATKQKIEEHLSAMVGRGFFLRGVHHEFLAYRFESERISVVTDKQWFSAEYQHALRLVDLVTEQPESIEQGISRLEAKAAGLKTCINLLYEKLLQVEQSPLAERETHNGYKNG